MVSRPNEPLKVVPGISNSLFNTQAFVNCSFNWFIHKPHQAEEQSAKRPFCRASWSCYVESDKLGMP